jgi:HK97 family phage major capsid protein
MTKFSKIALASASALAAIPTDLERKDLSTAQPGGRGLELKDLFQEHADAVEARLSELGVDTGALKAQLRDIEQKVAQTSNGGGDYRAPSWGRQFVEAEELKAFAENHSKPSKFRIDVKTTITTDSASGGAFGEPMRDIPIALPRRTLHVRDLLPVISTTSGSIQYPKQTSRTNNAAPVAEGAVKPESALAFSLETVVPKVIAHWIPASLQILEDSPQLSDLIDSELRYGLELVEDAQILYGDGVGQNLDGLVAQATTYSAPFDPAGTENMIDIAILATLQATLADFSPNGIIMHPSDWIRIRMLKDADGKYLLGAPGAAVEPRLFGMPVVTTTSMTIDKFLVGDFRAAATLYDRWAPRVEVSTEHADYFTRNLVAIRAEERIALAVKQSAALIYGDFGNVA